MSFDQSNPLGTIPLGHLLEICVDQLNDAIVITQAEPLDEPGPRIVWANKIFWLYVICSG